MKFKIPLFELNLEFRPIRLSALLLAVVMLGIVWLAFYYDVSGVVAGGETGSANPYTRGFIDAALLMVVVTTIGNALLRIVDDGGDSDAVKIANRHFDYIEGVKIEQALAEHEEAIDRDKADR